MRRGLLVISCLSYYLLMMLPSAQDTQQAFGRALLSVFECTDDVRTISDPGSGFPAFFTFAVIGQLSHENQG